MANKACPNPKSKEWRNITEKVGVFEAFRIFIRNGYDVPTFVFKDIKDVYKYLDFNANKNNILSKKDNVYYIPYGRDLGTWYTNSNLVKDEVNRINKIYDGLLLIKSKPVTKPNPLTPGRNKIEWVEVNEYALNIHYDIYNKEKEKAEEDSNENIIPIEAYEQRIDYTLKLTAALQKLQRNIFKQDKLQGWTNDLQKQGVPKEQIDFFKESAKEGMTKDDIIASISANYSYTIESNIAKQSLGKDVEYQYSIGKLDDGFRNITYGVYDPNNIMVAQYNTEQDAENYLKDIASKPAQYYSNLTVPGGTNYTENEIRTPQITPSIKGHAEFSTDQGIGWFRGDEKSNLDTRIKYLEEYRSTEEETAELEKLYEIHKKGVSSKTRRILEIQSDLFQKGRDKELLADEYNILKQHKSNLTLDEFDKLPVKSNIVNMGNEFVDIKNEIKIYNGIRYQLQILDNDRSGGHILESPMLNDNQFLQLLNKDNNWVTFFIKSIIQDSAKKGYEKVLFPSGETAAKVEGHVTIADEINKIDKEINKLKKETEPELLEISKKAIEGLEKQKQNLKTQGIEKLKPIEAFYEIRIQNILKKLYPDYKRITDEYGNAWFEYIIKPEDHNKLIELQKNNTIDKLSPENREDFEEKKKIMLNTFPRVNEVIEDYSIPQSGILEANGTIIRVNPRYYTEDTIGHEFGHLLIDLVGGTDNPLIRKGIEQLKSTSIWDNVLERYPDLYENNIDKFHKEVLAQAIGEDTSKIFKKQQEMSNFQRWLDRLFTKIKQILGIESSVSKKLARKVLSGKPINLDNNISDIYESRVQDEIKDRLEEVKEPKTKIETLREKALEVLQKKEAKFKKRDFKSNQDLISNTIKKIEDLDSDPKESLKLFQDFAIRETERIYNNYRDQDRKKRLYGEKFNLYQLSKWRDYVAGFSLLEEFIDLAKDYESEVDESFLNISKLNNTLNRKKTIENAYITEGLKLVAESLTNYSSHIEVEFKEKFEKEYNSLSEQEKIDKTKEEYIKEKLDIESDNIKILTQKLIEQELSKASKDIGQLSRYIDNILDSPDVVVSSMAKMYVEAEFKSREEYVKIQNRMVELTRNLEDYYNVNNILPNDPKKMYDFMLEKDKNGNYTQNIVDAYSSKLWDDYEALKNKLSSNENISYDEYNLIVKEWKNKNMPIDYNKFNPEKEKYWNQLLKEGLISKQEKIDLINNDDWRTENKKDVSEIVRNDKAVELIIQFYRDNLWKYRKPKTIYLNNQWLNLVKIAGGDINSSLNEQRESVKNNITNDPRIEFYNFINNTRDEIQLKIPYGHRLHTRLPSVLKSSEERLISKENTLSDMLKYTIKSNINVMSDENERGERILTDESGKPLHFIPIYYTASLRKIYANQYDKLSKEDKEKISKEDYINKKSDENQSYDLASIYSRYFNSAIEYSHKSEILPVMEMARDLVNHRETIQRDGKGNIIMQAISKGKEKALTKAGINSSIAAQLNDWFEAIMYGEKEKDEGTLLWGTIDKAKIANLLNKYTALNLLGLNFIQGTANSLLGSTMQWIEASGKQFYSPKDYIKAKYIYNKNLPGILGDIGERKPKNLINLLLQKFDILNEYDKPEFRKNSKFKKLLTTNTLFFTSHAGEHFMQTKVLLAMLNKIEAKDSNGKVIGKMIDMFSSKDGKLILDNRVQNFTEKDQALFEAKVRRVLSSLHGEYSNAGRVAIQRYALGRMAYMFRKFIMPGIKRRWGKKNINNLLGEYVEGNYVTTGKFMFRFFKDLSKFQFALMTTDWKSLTDMEKANIRKTLVEVSFMIGTSLLASALINMKNEDDDEDWMLSFLSYQAFRMKTELWFFSNPSEAMKILRSPAASMSVIENSIKLISQLLPPNFKGFQVYERGNWKGQPKINKTLINFIPGMKQIYRTKYVDDQITWLNR